MSPDAKRLLRRSRRWEPVDIIDAIVFLVCTHIAMLWLGYAWGHR